MGQPRVKWGQAERYFMRRNYSIVGRGGDKIVIQPKGSGEQGSRNQVRVGHTSCSHPGCEMLRCHLSKFHSVFGVSIQDILND